jgi:nicotinamidase-related amidase
MKKALVVVDMQNDFVCGSLGSAQALAIVDNVRAKIADFNRRGDYIYFTRDTHQSDYHNTQEGKNLPVEHCIAGTEGWRIYGGLDDVCGDAVYVDKPSFGWIGWRETIGPIADELDEIELCGLCTDICVVSNALIIKAQFPELKITVDARCCAGITNESHEAALLTMKMCQINIFQ